MGVNPFRNLPSVNDVLDVPEVQALTQIQAREAVVAAVREELSTLRTRLAQGEDLTAQATPPAVAARVVARLQDTLRPRLRNVINATGIILHTNLGRAPLAEEAAQAAYEAGRGYLNLELDLETGKRSSRQTAVRDWICQLTGAASATAVNNNAAATILVLRALCAGKEVIVSRGQLIEIGGSFRIPDIMAVSGATLREVGTTNITRLSDFERAITPQTGALLQIHTSNYRVAGFTKSVALADLVALGKKKGLPVFDDVGSGALFDYRCFGFKGEPVARESIAVGADLIMFSGDKLLGGPQAGMIAGRKEFIQRIEKDPLMRAFRLDKMTLAALEVTLRLHLHEERALRAIPTLAMLGAPLETLHQRALALSNRLQALEGLASVAVVQDEAYVGGGSLPDQVMKSWVLEVKARSCGETELAYRLRLGTPAVMGRVREGRLLLDVRTVLPHQETGLVEAVQRALEKPTQRVTE